MLIAKLALGFGGTILLAGAYTFREGTIRVDVDEFREGGAHVHFWVPAAAVPMALHFAPKDRMLHEHGMREAREWMPTVRTLLREMQKYPNVEFVDVRDSEQHVHIGTHNGKLQIDVDAPDQKVHIAVPIETIDDVTSELESTGPTA
jgi:hypothetical protein